MRRRGINNERTSPREKIEKRKKKNKRKKEPGGEGEE
jgi:hypothetical protein